MGLSIHRKKRAKNVRAATICECMSPPNLPSASESNILPLHSILAQKKIWIKCFLCDISMLSNLESNFWIFRSENAVDLRFLPSIRKNMIFIDKIIVDVFIRFVRAVTLNSNSAWLGSLQYSNNFQNAKNFCYHAQL